MGYRLQHAAVGAAVVTALTLSPAPSGTAGRPQLDPTGMRIAELLDQRFEDPAGTDELLAHLAVVAAGTAARVARSLGDETLRPALTALIATFVLRNVEEKLALRGPDGRLFPLTGEDIRRTIIDYEAFKVEAFISAGVFPKRYFGFFDLKWDTAAYERRLRVTCHAAVAEANAYLAAHALSFRISDAEVAVTFLAEGGALLLTEQQDHLDDIHPVMGVGLDDIASGFAKHAALVAQLDQRLGTGLRDVVRWDGERATVTRNFRFEEAIAGTAVMYVYEKQIAANKLRNAGRETLATLPLENQFVISSLVYNSGLTFDAGRMFQMRDFGTADYLAQLSEQNKAQRPELPVAAPREAARLLLAQQAYPEQPTSWSAVYHVMQRYGAYVALKRCTDLFDDADMLRGPLAP
jgi:hypothetical protein